MKLVVLSLLLALGSEDFSVRHAATETLKVLNNTLDLRVDLRLALESADLETRERVRSLLEEYENIVPTKGYFPRIEFIQHGWDENYQKIRENRELDEISGDSLLWYDATYLYEIDRNRRLATQDYVQTLFKDGWTRGQVRDFLDRAVKKEREAGRIPVQLPEEEP